MTHNMNFWEVSLLISTFNMSKVLALIFQVWYTLWLILGFSVRAKTVLVGPLIPKKRWHIRKNSDVEVICLFSMILLCTSDSKKIAWNYCKHHFPNIQCQWVALVANSCYWSSILSIRVHQKCDVASYFNEFCYRVVNVAAHDYSNYSPCGLSIPSCIFHKPLGQEKWVFDVCRQKLAILYFKKWFGRPFHLGILFVNEAFVPQNRIITIVEGQNRFDVSCTLGCEQKRVLIDWKRTSAVFDSTHVSICKVRFSVM